MSDAWTYDPIAFWARTRPERAALRMGEETWTYARLDEAVSTAAIALFEQGLVSGEHIAVEFGAEQGLHFATTIHALHRADLLPVPIGRQLKEPERVLLRRRAQVDFALTAAPEPAPRSGPRSSAGPTKPPLLERRLDTPAAICFTSGTEGSPRAVVLTHGNFLWSALASARYLGVRAEDVWLACLPLHHVGGLSVLTRSAYYGTSVLIQDRFHPESVNRAIDLEGVTLVSLVPPMLERLLDARGARRFPETLRAALIGGGPAPAALLRRAADLGMKALPTYGLTETTSQAATLPLREWPSGLDTAGRPLPFVRIEVRSADGHVLGPREEGEIVVRGPTVTGAYFDDERLNETAFDRGWYRTGDIGAWDESGRLVVLDRRMDRMVVGAENVSPFEVERVIAEHPAVADVCVVAIPAGAWGHEIVAAVVLRRDAGLTLEDLREHAGRHLAPFKLPRRLHIADALPRSDAGKILRGEVRSWFADQVAEKNRA